MYRLIISITSLLCCALMGAAQASDSFAEDVMAISYDDGSGVDTSDGTGKAERYDVALMLDDTSLIGKSIVGVRIPFASTEDLSGLKVWAASTLALTESDNLPVCDIAQESADIDQGWTEVIFSTPISLSGTGIYLGYSFDVDKINSNNLKPVCLTSAVSQNGYFIHTSRTTKYKKGWTNVNENTEVGSLRMQVMVKGLDGNAASIEVYPKINVRYGAVAYAPVRIICHGYNGVSSISYAFDINGKTGEQTYTLDTPIAPVYNKYADVEIPLAEITEVGQLPFTINVTKVNGADNTDVAKTGEGILNVFDFVPVHRPLFEEYTGAWCGNCPRGLAAIETMKERYADDFICISYHNSDAMEVTTSFPSEIRGFPDSWISRKKRTDPFFGDKSDGQFHLDEEWEAIRKEPTTISVDVDAEWTDLDESSIEVKVKIMSQINYSPQALAIGCALIADDLHGEGSSWWQTNYYAGKSETCAPELKWIAEYPSTIRNFRFNDVLILGRNLDGAEANLPFDIEPMNEYEVSFTLPLDEALNTSGVSLVQDKSKLRVVAFGVDRESTEVINSNQTPYMVSSSGINDLLWDTTISAVDYFDLLGNKVGADAKGVIIRVTHYANGLSICHKIIK